MSTLPDAPGPRGDLLLGSTLDFKAKPLQFIQYAARAYGDVSRFRVGPQYWYLITNPEHIWDVMVGRPEIFLKPAIARRLWSKFLGDGILTAEGETWTWQHKMMRPAFHRQRIEAYGETMVAFTHRLIDSWEPSSRRDKSAVTSSSPRQNLRTPSRYLSFHSRNGCGQLPS